MDVGEAGGGQLRGDGFGLVGGEAVGVVAVGAGWDEPLGEEEPPAGGQDPAGLGEPSVAELAPLASKVVARR